ncbi:hypothetical protein QQA05_00215 [Corynebacterium macclintockiae]|uniref:hypothetical protein n=1 Tax=Corynebacterium macclintockiae TaxID=2913501 RepID=UPI00254FE5F1|nr:hypothetical protein [Corynebacterium macclintockiae]MDK8889838.1 hypothetical protein [Corynebacterium macclintockiae]
MAIKTVLLGKMRGEGWLFQPKENVRYCLPKGDYTFLAVISPGSTRGLSIFAGGSVPDLIKASVFVTKRGIEWVEFSGDIWRVAIVPGAVEGKAPGTMPAPNPGGTPPSNFRGEFELDVLYKVGDTVRVSNQTPSAHGTYECTEEHTSSFYDYPWNSTRRWKKIRDANGNPV